MIECLTDNKNRAVAEVRTALSKNGGSMGESGSVAFMFNRKGVVIVPKKQPEGEATEDGLLEVVLDSGAEEVNDLGESFEIISEATDLVAVRESLRPPVSTTTPRKPPGCRRWRCRSTSTAPAR